VLLLICRDIASSAQLGYREPGDAIKFSRNAARCAAKPIHILSATL